MDIQKYLKKHPEKSYVEKIGTINEGSFELFIYKNVEGKIIEDQILSILENEDLIEEMTLSEEIPKSHPKFQEYNLKLLEAQK